MLSYLRLVLGLGACATLSSTALACSGGLNIEIESAGVYALDQAKLVAAAPDLADCPRTDLFLTHRGKEIPIRLSGSGDTLQPGERIEWVGEPLHGPETWFDAYSTVNVYQLGASPGPHARIVDAGDGTVANKASLSRSLHLEQENLMIRLNQGHVKPWQEVDFWHWAKLTHVDPQPFELALDLPDLAPHGAAVTVQLKFRGMSDIIVQAGKSKPDDHRVDVLLGANTVGSFSWNGRAEVVHSLTLPLAALRESGNPLRLSVPKRLANPDDTNPIVDVVMFNALDVTYPIQGDLNRSAEPLHAGAGSLVLRHAGARLALYSNDGQRYLGTPGSDSRFASAGTAQALYPVVDDAFAQPLRLRARPAQNWHAPDTAYDYLIISHARLIDAVTPLAQFHRQRGLKVAVLDADDVYDQFNHGIAHPRAIRDLLQQAYREWPQPRPRFALLVGDASFDIRHQRIDRMALAKWADRELLTPGQFGDIPSTPYAQTPTDLKHRNLIPTWQFMSYDGQSASDNHFVSVGDDPLHPVMALGRFPVVEPAEVKAIVDKTINYLSTPQYGAWRRDVMFITDESDYFKNTSDQIAQTLDSEGFVSEKVYASPDEKDNLAHQSSIKDGLNEGRLLVHFIGHGGRYIWRTGPPDLRKNHDLFTLEDVSALSNGARLPMILSMTCYSAPFDNPTEDSIGERFLREPGKGAVAVFAASWRNSPSAEFSKTIVAQLTKPGVTIGEAIVAGKRENLDATMVETYNLLGDPAVVLERPEGGFRLSAKQRPFGPTAIEAQIDRDGFHGMVEASWVDARGQTLYRSRFVALGRRFALPEPPAAIRAAAAEVRGYIADPQRTFDAIARLDLRPPVAAPVATPNKNPLKAAAQRAEQAAQVVPLAPGDRVLQQGFEPAEDLPAGQVAAANLAQD